MKLTTQNIGPSTSLNKKNFNHESNLTPECFRFVIAKNKIREKYHINKSVFSYRINFLILNQNLFTSSSKF